MNPAEVIRMRIDGGAFRLCEKMAKLSTKYGHTRIKPEERQARCSTDQLVGQLGEYATVVQLCGSARRYVDSQNAANANLTDNGSDLGGGNLDVKTTHVKFGAPPFTFRLLVESSYLRDEWVYSLALVQKIERDYAVVCLVGWATGAVLLQHPCEDEDIISEYAMNAQDLNPFAPIRWEKVRYL